MNYCSSKASVPSAFLPKTFTPAELLNQIHEVLRSPTQPRREHDRVDCRGTEVDCEWSKRHTKAQGVNLSEDGILLENLHELIPQDERVVLSLKTAAGDQNVSLRGRVVRRAAPSLIAVRFEDLSLAEACHSSSDGGEERRISHQYPLLLSARPKGIFVRET